MDPNTASSYNKTHLLVGFKSEPFFVFVLFCGLKPLHHLSAQDIPDDIRANLTEELLQPREIPKRLNEYTQEEIDAFPRVFTPYVKPFIPHMMKQTGFYV